MNAAVLCAVGVAILCALPVAAPAAAAPSRSDTVWIFDADFEDLAGDNAGWTSRDMSGEPGGPNYWHRDTVRTAASNLPSWDLGDSCWWCGKYDTLGCWMQSRGYGNQWTQDLWREFPEIAANTAAGDDVLLEYNTRWALESGYDYAYVEISDDGGSTWTRLMTHTNESVLAHPGWPVNWYRSGVKVVDLSSYAGQSVMLRFRVETSYQDSSQDQYDDSRHSYRDGAWMIDNMRLKKNGVQFWYDDCESFGDNGWVAAPTEPHDQTGVAFTRTLEDVVDPPRWMMSAYAESTGLMVDDELTYLMSPPIDVSGAGSEDVIVLKCSGWMDLPGAGPPGTDCRDRVTIGLRREYDAVCVWSDPAVWDIESACSVGPVYGTLFDALVYEQLAGHSWLGVQLRLEDTHNNLTAGHGRGFMLDRMRVGILATAGVPDGASVTELGIVQPNPMKGETSIAFTASGAGKVTLRVYDLLGRAVRTLVDGPVGPGEHEAVWDGLTDIGSRAAGGVYFVKLMDGNGQASEAKLVLLK